jgi:starvation-inducible DNA-binding protein
MDYHLLLDEQAAQLLATTDPMAEWVSKLEGLTLYSIGHVRRLRRVLDNDTDYESPPDMLAELCGDNKDRMARMRELHDLCDRHRDVAIASLLEVLIDEGEQRRWFLFEATRLG